MKLVFSQEKFNTLELPHDECSERAILSILLHKEHGPIYENNFHIKQLDPAEFYNIKNKILFRCFIDLYRKNGVLDLITIQDDLDSKGILNDAGGMIYILSIEEDMHWNINNLNVYVESIKKYNLIRNITEYVMCNVGDFYEIHSNS